MMIGMSVLLVYRHQSNIQNLLQGKESKIGQKKTQKAAEVIDSKDT